MTPEEIDELIGCYIDDELPEAVATRIARYLTDHPEAARDAQTLRETVQRLRAAPPPRTDDWFVERALDRLLREHGAAQAERVEDRTHTR